MTDRSNHFAAPCRELSYRRYAATLAMALLLAVASHLEIARAEPISAEPLLSESRDSGQQIYEQTCSNCHGSSGNGSAEYPHPLVGDRSLSDLARFVGEKMPKDAPGTLEAAEAQRVAAYVYDAFYSKIAQARHRPPRIDVAHLTERQYRQTIADLIGAFRDPLIATGERGLHGEYFKTRRLRDENRVIDRTDATVAFDFGESTPEPGKFETGEFSIRWTGSLIAADTGEYEFVIRSKHAASLWLNDPRRPLIDALVKSGDEIEHRASIHLLGGRRYPLRLEFIRSKQGVDDSDKSTAKVATPPDAAISLAWKPPRRPEEIVPERQLSPRDAPVTYVVATPFPPDDRSVGFERGTAVSKAWDQATTDAALDAAEYVAANVRELSGVADEAPDRLDQLRAFAYRFVERAFRRPLSESDRQRLVDRRLTSVKDVDLAIKQIVLATLKSPRFLYHETAHELDGYEVASRLSLGLWDSLPDQALLDAAAANQLATREQVARQATRMLDDPRAVAKLRQFLLQWLKVDAAPELSKDPNQYPDFGAAIAADLRTSLELFLDDVIASPAADFRQLLLADYVFLNDRLAKFYGLDLPTGTGFQRVVLDGGSRAGVLSHPYLLSHFAYTSTSSPIHRGLFLARSVLGRTLRPPPEGVAPLAPDLHPDLTTRERVTLQTSPDACQMCHRLINPLGFTLEHFDAVGRYRNDERGRVIDARGEYETAAGQRVELSSVRALAQFLADSEEAHAAFAEHLFHHLVKQPIYAYGIDTVGSIHGSLARNEFNIRRLMVEVMATSALVARTPPQRVAESR